MIKKYKTKRRPEKEMIFGIRAVIEALNAGKDIDKIMIRRDMSNDLSRELMATIGEHRVIPIQKVPLEKLNQSTERNHQGVIAFISPIAFQRLEDIIPQLYEKSENPLVVVLDGITDVRNFGAIARTSECAGVHAIVVATREVSSINADAIKTSVGALMRIPICKEEDIKTALHFLKNSGLQTVGISEKSTKNYTLHDFNQPTAIVMGSEERGIAREHLELCDATVSIPMIGNISSLNVSVATGIAVYEIVRQRNLKQ